MKDRLFVYIETLLSFSVVLPTTLIGAIYFADESFYKTVNNDWMDPTDYAFPVMMFQIQAFFLLIGWLKY